MMRFRSLMKIFLLVLLLLWPPLAGYAEFINGDLFVVGLVNSCSDAGSSDTYACTPTDTRLTAYVTGSLYGFKANTINTGPATFNYNALGAKTIKKQVGGITTDLADGDIQAGQWVLLQYDGTNMQMLSTRGSNTLTVLNPQTATYQALAADFAGNKTILVASGTFTITLVASGATQPSTGQSIKVLNYGTGTVTIARSGQNINGGTASLVVPPGTATAPMTAWIVSNGTDYFATTTMPSTTVKSIFIPAGSMDVEGACAVNATAVLLTSGPKLVTIGCTDADADGISFDMVMPDSWNAGTVTVELNAFSIGNNTTEVFEMDFAGQCVRSGDAVAAHSTTGEQPATITWPATALVEVHATTAAITLNGTCAAGAHVYMRGQVDATATTMTPMSDLKILGVKVEYTAIGGD
jgi:hypothetical protein